MTGSSYLRQQDLVDAERLSQEAFTIIGTGAVGSFTTLALAKMGANKITVYDPDRIQSHNLPNQFFRECDLGIHKVEALADIIYDHASVEIEAKGVCYRGQELKGIVISAVDSMEARKLIWNKVKRNAQVSLYIDARMGAEVARIYSIDPLADIELYEESLYGSDEALQEPCTRRAIIYTVIGISALVCGQVRKYLMNEALKRELVMDFKNGVIMP